MPATATRTKAMRKKPSTLCTGFCLKMSRWRRSAGGSMVPACCDLVEHQDLMFRTLGLHRIHTKLAQRSFFFVFPDCGFDDSYTGPITSSGYLFSYLVGLSAAKIKRSFAKICFHLHQEPGLEWVLSAHGVLPKTKPTSGAAPFPCLRLI